MAIKQIPEANTVEVDCTFLDGDNAVSLPTSVQYRIDCETTDTAILGWTTASPATTVTFTVTAAQNEIISNLNDRETRVLTVNASQGDGYTWTGEHKWIVRNLKGYP